MLDYPVPFWLVGPLAVFLISALKGAFADLSRGFFQVVGLVKTTVLLGFTLAAHNLDRISVLQGEARPE